MIKLEEIQGAIFDMDGTLIDSMKMWKNIASDYLMEKGIRPEENLGETMQNMSLEQGTQYVIDRYSLEESLQEVLAGIHTLIASKYKNELQAKEGVIELIQKLADQKTKMCVATASDYPLAKLCLERIGVLHYLQGIYTCDEIGSGKEEPKLFIHAWKQLGTKMNRTYVFEDSLHAVRTAKKAGFPVIAVYDESAKKDEEQLRKCADYHIQSMKELYEL